MYKKIACSFLLLVMNAFLLQGQDIGRKTSLRSPDGKIAFDVLVENGSLHYSVRFAGRPVILSSALGIRVNGIVIGDAAKFVAVTRSRRNETYATRGVHGVATNRCNTASVTLMTNDLPLTVDVRVFNDGVTFRYVIAGKDSSLIDKELTSFTLPAGSLLWSQSNIKYYEGRYTKKNVDTIPKDLPMGPPVTVQLPQGGGYAAITEGGLTDFAGMSLVTSGERTMQAVLSGLTRKYGNIETPWRIIEIGKTLNTLVNCDIIANVSPAYDKKLFPNGYKTEWIKPGRSVWSWLAKTRAVTLENMKHFSDLAAQLGFEYNLVDEGWGKWKDSAAHRDQWDMMKELVDYSAAKGVKVWVWKAYPDRGGIPGIKDPQSRKAFFKRCKEIGIVGLKVDFFDSENQEIIAFYQDALRDAAEYNLMMDFHGANKPTGESRTWPNEMTREAVRGLENRPPWAEGNTTLPFTRYLAGGADFTPVHFGDRMGEVSWSHQVAGAVVFTSPFLCYGADPQSILDHPAKDLIQSIPTTWDETLVLPQSKIGELVLYARRKGTTWFLAAMNGTHEGKSVKIDLSFLKKGGYKLSAMKDDKTKQAAAVLENTEVNAASVFTIDLNPEGGFTGRFDKLK